MAIDAHKTGHSSRLPEHDDVAFEPRDVESTGVLKFLVYLALIIAATLFICWGVLRLTQTRIAQFDTPPPPVRQGVPPKMPPEPRLQAQGLPGHDRDPQQDLRDKLNADREALEKAAWVDEKAGIAQIPIKDAMRIIAEKGLPAAPQSGAPKK